ncbi:unnamed protein product [Peronospora belbahrii]|uniref:Glycoside hydrolase n=1 Tax=Peronospora belbahrii TaxID=622444 RepID=A0ABN8D7X9_9STRA|nr:unnamed protein product [Peronospora belbahrii]
MLCSVFHTAPTTSFLLVLAGIKFVQADTLCSLPPLTYAKAKTAYPASAFAIEALEKHGIATWYSDRIENGNYAQTAADLVASCPEESRLSVVVYGLPNKDCAAKESAVGSTVHSASDYVAFLNTLTSAIGNRKVLYVLEPDAIGLLADTTGCGQGAGYLANLQTAVNLLSQNENAEIYLDVGYWTLQYPGTSTAVAEIVKQLAYAGSKVKGITLNTSNYQSTSTLATLCSNFQTAFGSTDLHCIFDTSRSYHGGSASNEWCNIKCAGIGALPTSDTGISNVDYFLWIKPPGDSDGTCAGHASDSMQGPGAGIFFDKMFQSLWNQGIMVAEKGYPAINTISNLTAPASSQQKNHNNQMGLETDMNFTTLPSLNAVSPKITSSTITLKPSAGQLNDHLTRSQSQRQKPTESSPSSSVPVPKVINSQQISTESSDSKTMGTGAIVLIALVAAAVVTFAVLTGIRSRQKKMLNEVKTPEFSALAPLPTTIVNFQPQPTALARDSNIL